MAAPGNCNLRLANPRLNRTLNIIIIFCALVAGGLRWKQIGGDPKNKTNNSASNAFLWLGVGLGVAKFLKEAYLTNQWLIHDELMYETSAQRAAERGTEMARVAPTPLRRSATVFGKKRKSRRSN